MGGRRRGKRTMKGGNFYGAAVDAQLGSAGLAYPAVTNEGPTGGVIPKADISGGRRRGTRRRGMSAKAMKRVLKKNGLKVSGKKSTLTKRMKKAKLMKGGSAAISSAPVFSSFTGAGTAGLISPVQGSQPQNVGVHSV